MIANMMAFVLCALASSRLCVLVRQFNAKTQRRRDAKGGVKLWLQIQLTLMQKSSICGGAKYISDWYTTTFPVTQKETLHGNPECVSLSGGVNFEVPTDL